jgi:hypothetical protein
MSGHAIMTRRYSVQQPGLFIPRFLTNMIAGANAGTAASTVQMANGTTEQACLGRVESVQRRGNVRYRL